ncbi:histidine decarboxylase [Methylomarinovum caldicuralii]|uniref:Histidine decarboxylase n=1 Tax=Methylomarinovum caldicuralii TaxID=438856 RepID=A0AAU9BRL4_9GAMM|nr:aminotransferase class V-fold PLP-dependent enzyme [Methylomarinovum caldicuralii]BCX81453.1 histidine decarboxylase [Methylomarinovum caldicuralii]
MDNAVLPPRASKAEPMLGYPINLNPPPPGFARWRRRLRRAGIGILAYNNGGNPYAQAPVPHHTHPFERRVVARCGRLYGFPADDLWGFVSGSGTDSNLHALHLGRTWLQDRYGVAPRCYFTAEAHYSIPQLADLLGLETALVATDADGAMAPADLARRLAHDRPALVVATVGTTFRGAVDPLPAIGRILANMPHFLHVDAAAFGGYLPYTAFAHLLWQQTVNFDSLAVSCHKFFGFHSPAGLFLTRRSLFDAYLAAAGRRHRAEYLGHFPGTLSCSRDAVKPAEFLYYTTPRMQARLAADARRILGDTAWLLAELETRRPDLEPRRAHPASNVIWFRHPGETVVRRYHLACQDGHAHVVVMPHAHRGLLTRFLDDLERR